MCLSLLTFDLVRVFAPSGSVPGVSIADLRTEQKRYSNSKLPVHAGNMIRVRHEPADEAI